MTPRRTAPARAARLLLAAVAAVATVAASGCSLLSPTPTWEAVKAAGTMLSFSVGTRGAAASNTIYHLHSRPARVCIEFNPSVPVADLLPALQNELKHHAVDSRVFAAGAADDGCSHWLRYSASVEWETRPFSSSYSRYLASATLSLHQADGRVLASSGYDAGDGLFTGKWASTRDKLSPVVAALLTGFENWSPDRSTR